MQLNLLASSVFRLKMLADKTRIFRQRGVAEIIQAISGETADAGKFPVVENYHCIAGERPSNMLAQIARELGAHIWYERKGWHVRTFAELFNSEPAFAYHHGKPMQDFQIISFKRPSQQSQLQDIVIRNFTGWNDTHGRVKAPSSGSVLAKAEKPAPVQFSSQNVQTLGNQPTTYRIAIDFLCYGNGHLTPGMLLKLWWHTGIQEMPLDESLPDKVLIFSVAHWFSAQKYYCRILGAVSLEPIQN